MQRPFSSYPNAIPTGLEASPILRSDFVGAYSAGPSTTEVQEAERKKEVHTEPLYNILCWRIFVFSLLYFVISLELDGEWTVKSRRISFGSDAKWGRSFEEFHSSFAGGRTCFTAPPLHTKERERARERRADYVVQMGRADPRIAKSALKLISLYLEGYASAPYCCLWRKINKRDGRGLNLMSLRLAASRR